MLTYTKQIVNAYGTLDVVYTRGNIAMLFNGVPMQCHTSDPKEFFSVVDRCDFTITDGVFILFDIVNAHVYYKHRL